MTTFDQALLLILLTTGLGVVARRCPWPAPITYVAGGLAASWVPGYEGVILDPDIFFLCFLPPLLFSDGWLMPLRDFLAARRPILLLSTGLVVFTTVAVGLAVHALIPGVPLALAFALGAVVSPTDAVAVNAITARLRVPTRIRIVLNGESLMNDATGLVAFRFALGAALAGSFSVTDATLQFLWVALGGLGLGLLLAFAVGKLRDALIRTQNSDAAVEVTLSLLTPYAAYIGADAAGVSGVLSVVAAGLYSGWRDPLKMDVETRQTTFTVWAVLLFWLNGMAFVLLGLEFPRLVGAVQSQFPWGDLLAFTALVTGVTILARVVWFFPGAYLPFLIPQVRRLETPPPWQAVTVGAWAGMRGSVTLAAALSIPLVLPDGSPLPGRDLVIFLSFGVIVVTLVLQGTTLPWLIRTLGLREDDTQQREEKLARITAVEAGLRVLRQIEQEATTTEEEAAVRAVLGEYERRLAELSAEGESRTSARRRLAVERIYRQRALAAERSAIDDLRTRDAISDEVHRPLQHLLDSEEAMLRGQPLRQVA